MAKPVESDRDSTGVEKGSISVTEHKEVIESTDPSLPPPPVLDHEQERRLYRKIDLRLMPILSIMYLCSFLDRGELL